MGPSFISSRDDSSIKALSNDRLRKKQFSSSHNFVHFRKIQDIILGSSPF